MRWYALVNLALQPGQAFSASVSDGGKEIWLTTSLNKASFDLSVYAALEKQSVASRSNVVVHTGQAVRIRPASSAPAAMKHTKILMDVVDIGNGNLIKQVAL